MSHELLTALRESTHALHQELDHHPMMALLLMPQVEAHAYGNTLAWLHPLQSNLEAQLLQRLPMFAEDIELAPRIPALEADLQQLNVAPKPLPAELKFMLTVSEGSLAGMLYVLNGARLGSAHIARRLQHTSPQLPCRYFAQANGALHWPPTLKLLENLPVSEYSDCKLAAEAVFRWYIKVMGSAQQESALIECLNHK